MANRQDANVFLSWSQDASEDVAGVLAEWLPTVVQAAIPWTAKQIPKGASWWHEINEAIAAVSFGVICVTEENLDKEWLHFEAGAFGGRSLPVASVLFDVDKNRLQTPSAYSREPSCTRRRTCASLSPTSRMRWGP